MYALLSTGGMKKVLVYWRVLAERLIGTGRESKGHKFDWFYSPISRLLTEGYLTLSGAYLGITAWHKPRLWTTKLIVYKLDEASV